MQANAVMTCAWPRQSVNPPRRSLAPISFSTATKWVLRCQSLLTCELAAVSTRAINRAARCAQPALVIRYRASVGAIGAAGGRHRAPAQNVACA